MKRRGFTLAETMVATFILFSTLVIFAALVDTALRYYAQIEKRNQAASVADRKYEEIRDWARTNYVTGNWNTFLGPTTDPYYPDMQVSVQSDWLAPLSPSTELEQEFAAANRVDVEDGVRRVQIQVDWSDAIDSNRQLQVVYYISPPRRNLPLTVDVQPSGGVANPLPNGGTANFAARAYDADGDPVMGLTYAWEIIPVTPNPGSATIEPSRSGRAATLINHVYSEDSAILALPTRNCKLRVYTRYCGQEYSGEYSGITLSP